MTDGIAKTLVLWLDTSLRALESKLEDAHYAHLDSVFPVLRHALDRLIVAIGARMEVHINIPVDYRPFPDEDYKKVPDKQFECKVGTSNAEEPTPRKDTLRLTQ
jgi:hypothetical protein